VTCSAVLSNMYAMGVTECDNMLMLLSISQKMTDKERDVVMPFIMSGFKVKHFLHRRISALPCKNIGLGYRLLLTPYRPGGTRSCYKNKISCF